MTSTAATYAVLRRLAAPRPPRRAGEVCEMCAAPVTDDHRHVVDLETRAMLCTCRGCALLFPGEAAHLRFKAVPDRVLVFDGLRLGLALWDELAVPVGLALFFSSSARERVVAFYPGPAGATESELPLAAWDAVLAANPGLATALPDVEALVLRGPRGGAPARAYLAPVDVCYALVGRLRQTWRGFDGGAEARAAVDDFFAGLEERGRHVGATEAVR